VPGIDTLKLRKPALGDADGGTVIPAAFLRVTVRV
jgi:hypothetical protein